MKRLIIAFVTVAGIIVTASGQQVKAIQTARIKTPTVGCEECKTRLETYLKRYDGVSFINVNWRKKETTVKYFTDRINIEEIKTAIANAGYDADDVPANPESYKRLPQTCKKPEDGGHIKPKY